MKDSLCRWPRAPRDALVGVLALFGACNVVAGLLGLRNRNDLWVRAGGLPSALVSGIVLAFAVAWALRHRHGKAATLARGTAGVLALFCFLDARAYEHVRALGAIHAGWPLSLSLLLGCVLAWTAASPGKAPPGPARPKRRAALLAVSAAGFVLLHLLSFGATDYRAPADAAVVFGSAVRSDGRPSGSLYDRTTTACRLWEEGLVPHLVLSGGRNPAMPISEPDCMARIAREHGVPEDALTLDESGVTSAATLDEVARLARERDWSRVLLVSHDYHLARLHLLASHRGLNVRTVPAVETVPWPTKPLFVLREVAAWSWYFLRTAR